jgi:hypothetical protein
MGLTNTQAFYIDALITTVKYFMIQAPGLTFKLYIIIGLKSGISLSPILRITKLERLSWRNF